MILIAITGAIGHGKTSLAQAFLKCEPTAIHNESSLLISAFANNIKDTLPAEAEGSTINNWLKMLPHYTEANLHIKIEQNKLPKVNEGNLSSPDFEKLVSYINKRKQNPEFAKQTITPLNKPHHRDILQWLGGFFVNHISRTIWYDELIRRATIAKDNGCSLYVCGGLRFPEEAASIRMARGIVIEIKRPTLPEAELMDPTERERADITYDIEVINSGSLKQLEQIAFEILNDLKNGRLQPIYHAT